MFDKAEYRIRQNLQRKERRLAKRHAGICTECNQSVMIGYTRCEKHHFENKASYVKIKNARLSQGLCNKCGEHKLAGESQCCESCILKYLAFRLWKDKERWAELLNLYNKQNRLCVYTGRVLIIGTNASIDHVVPKSKGGDSNIMNLQWVDYIVNIMKLNQSEDEFLTVIREIVAHKHI